jgi:altronate dehydratase
VLPSSLCAGKIAELIADKLNDMSSRDTNERGEGGHGYDPSRRFDRFVALPHTEGCGVEYAHNGIDVYTRTMVGHILHPSVVACVMLEHGCEKTHNDFFRLELDHHGPDGETFPILWASVQLDGGIRSVTEKVVQWIYGTPADGTETKTDTSTATRVPSPLPWVGVEPTPTSLRLHNLCIGLVGSRVALQNTGGCLPPGRSVHWGAIVPC